MAEMKPFTFDVTATLKIGNAETVKTVKIEMPVSVKFDGNSNRGTVSIDQDGFHRHIAALTGWFSDFPAELENG